MKRTFVFGMTFLILALSLSAVEVRAGVLAGPTGTLGIDVVAEGGLEFFDDAVTAEVGIELGMALSTARLIFPVGLAWEAYLEDGWSIGVAAHALAGGTIAAPLQDFFWGGELELRSELAWVPGFAVGATLGIRYLGSAWEFPLQVLVEIPLGPEDEFKLTPERDDSEKDGY